MTDMGERRYPVRSALRRVVSPTLRGVLYARGLCEDLKQELMLVTWQQREASDIELMRAVQRAIYAFLKSEGFRRQKHATHYDDPILPISVAVHTASVSEAQRQRLQRELGEYAS